MVTYTMRINVQLDKVEDDMETPMASQSTEWVNMSQVQMGFIEQSYLNWIASLPGQFAAFQAPAIDATPKRK